MEPLLQQAASSERIECFLEEDRVRLTAAGKSGHGSYPPSGINAVSILVELLQGLPYVGGPVNLIRFVGEKIGREAFGESLGLAVSDPVHGRLTINLGQMEVRDKESIALLNLRYPVTENGPSLIDSLREAAWEYGIRVEVLQHLEPLYVPPGHPLIRKLSRAYEAVTGEKAELLSIGGGPMPVSCKTAELPSDPASGERTRKRISPTNLYRSMI
ncbi:peptidase dimerization domain-containing protein [Paenibacillus sp. CC-CFT747]|nr:peptidase dimerization domain-containing protein [Paenibacillus sp. CC-CFT747]